MSMATGNLTSSNPYLLWKFRDRVNEKSSQRGPTLMMSMKDYKIALNRESLR